MSFFLRLAQLVFFILFVSVAFAQNHLEHSTCYNMKSLMGKASAASQLDTRGDFIDILNYSIDLDITNFATKQLSGNTELRFTPLQSGQNKIDLDFLILDIDSITFMDSLLTSYTYNDTLIGITFPATLQIGTNYTLKIFYNGAPIQIPGDWGGFFWNNTYAYNIGVSFTEDIHNFGKAWFPCFDNFTEKSTYDFLIKTQSNHKAFCGGVLQNVTTNFDGTKSWYWVLNEQIPTYLASVAVANYATVYDSYSGSSLIPIEFGALANDTTNMKNSFIHLKDAMSSYESRYGKYRFDRIGYNLTSFTAGAMEHATNVTYMKAAANGTTQLETLMAHELAHSWWGNNTTCKTAEDMWLNEGFASFSEEIFIESVYGNDAYKDYSRKNHDDVLRRTHIRDGAYLSVSGVSTENTYSSTVYDKGADIIHTIRGILGDDLFFKTLKDIQEKYKFNNITTELFNQFINDSTNLNLNSFFNTWIKEPGFHHFEIADITISENDSKFIVQGSIKQKLRETNYFTDFLPIEISFFDADWNRVNKTIFIYGECSDFDEELDFEPVFIALDLDEKIHDATVDKYLTIKNNGVQDFGLARIELDIKNIEDSSLVRIVHHFVKPDPMVEKINNLHLSPNRYWSVNGIFSDNFKADAKFLFNGTTDNSIGYLDNDLITNIEDSLTILYRPDTKTDWTIVDSFTLNTQGSSFNKRGFLTVFNVQKGDYVLAIYDQNEIQDNSTKSECFYTNIIDVEKFKNLIKVFPVPANEYINIAFLEKNTKFKTLKVFNILGKEMNTFSLAKNIKQFKIETKDWDKGNYFFSFITKEGKSLFSKKVLIE